MTTSRNFALAHSAEFIDDLGALVNIDCGTHNKAGVDAVGAGLRARCMEWGWEVDRLPQPQLGDFWLARLRGSGAGRLFLIGHLDTVYANGTALARPMRLDGERLIGPGVCDMKGGLLVGLYALRALQAEGFDDFEEIAFFFNSDEEIGSPVSQAAYTPVARAADAALVLEAARASGDIVSARKASGEFKITVKGKAAHAGVEPEKGANAVLELAHQIIAMRKLDGLAPGVTVNPAVLGGGAKVNVIPDEAWALADIRASDAAGVRAVTEALNRLPAQTTIAGTRVTVSGHFAFPPMARTPATSLLAGLAKEAAGELGFSVGDVATGGASDANIIAGLGVPVLDGLGPVGGLDHSPDEYIEAGSIVPRTAMLAEFIRKVLARRAEVAALRSAEPAT